MALGLLNVLGAIQVGLEDFVWAWRLSCAIDSFFWGCWALPVDPA